MKSLGRIANVIAAGVLSVSLCAAQENPTPAPAPKRDPQTQPAQPYGPLYQPPADDTAEAQAKPVADTRPLSGILGLTLGSLKANENTLTTSFRVGQVFDSNPGVLGQGSDYTGASSIGGNLTLHRAGMHQALDITYSGGTVVYNDTADLNSYHQLNLVQTFSVRRWTVTLTDSLNYSPEGSLGAGLGFGNFGSQSLGLSGTNSLMTPNQSIYTPLGRRLMNTAGGQIQYGLGPRSSWTVGATYGSVYYPDGEFGNTHQINARMGYNRNWTANDTVSIFYDYGAYRGISTGLGGGTDTHSVQLAYARRVTGRLSWSVSAGPQITKQMFSDELGVSWTASTGLQYQRTKTGVSFGYSHGISEPAGAIGGTRTDMLQLGITHTVTQHWSVGVNGSLSRNAPLIGTAEFRSGVAGVQVQRTLGQRASVYANYGFQRQIADGNCVGLICTGLSRQVFGFGFSWSPRPWIIR